MKIRLGQAFSRIIEIIISRVYIRTDITIPFGIQMWKSSS